jgi:hypothetical protein
LIPENLKAVVDLFDVGELREGLRRCGQDQGSRPAALRL